MSSTEYKHDGDQVYRLIETGTQTAEIQNCPYRVLRLTPRTGEVIGDGTDVETVDIEVVDGVEFAAGDLASASVLSIDVEASVQVDGTADTITLTDGTASFDVTTTKQAGDVIELNVTLTNYPARYDEAEIQVKQ